MGFKLPVFWKKQDKQESKVSCAEKTQNLNCRISLISEKENDSPQDIFKVDIKGSIYVPDTNNPVSVKISIKDITDGISNSMPTNSTAIQWREKDSQNFCYSADLGKLPDRLTVLSDWMEIAQLQRQWISLPRKGQRNLQFEIKILSFHSNEQLACAYCNLNYYYNDSIGYLDTRENIQRAKVLAVSIAFTLSAIDNNVDDRKVDVIENWAKKNFNISNVSKKEKRKFNKSLKEIIHYFRDGNKIDVYKLCKLIVKIAPAGVRYDILELCLSVTRADGIATVEELALLKNLANWLDVDVEKFASMVEKYLPVNIHEIEDIEIVLGITKQMSEEKTIQQLRQGYRKWNARITNSNSEIQNQASRMLELIVDARIKYTD